MRKSTGRRCHIFGNFHSAITFFQRVNRGQIVDKRAPLAFCKNSRLDVGNFNQLRKKVTKKAISPSVSANRALKRERGLFKAAPESQRSGFTAVPFNQGPGGMLGVERWKLGMSLRERLTTLLKRIITREQRETLGN